MDAHNRKTRYWICLGSYGLSLNSVCIGSNLSRYDTGKHQQDEATHRWSLTGVRKTGIRNQEERNQNLPFRLHLYHCHKHGYSTGRCIVQGGKLLPSLGIHGYVGWWTGSTTSLRGRGGGMLDSALSWHYTDCISLSGYPLFLIGSRQRSEIFGSFTPPFTFLSFVGKRVPAKTSAPRQESRGTKLARIFLFWKRAVLPC